MAKIATVASFQIVARNPLLLLSMPQMHLCPKEADPLVALDPRRVGYIRHGTPPPLTFGLLPPFILAPQYSCLNRNQPETNTSDFGL
jgi:hypothetical protein